VKPHLPKQGHEKLQKEKEDENTSQVGETFIKEEENGDHISLWCKIRFVA